MCHAIVNVSVFFQFSFIRQVTEFEQLLHIVYDCCKASPKRILAARYYPYHCLSALVCGNTVLLPVRS